MEIESTVLEISEFYHKELKKKGEEVPAVAMREIIIDLIDSAQSASHKNSENLSSEEKDWATNHVGKYSEVLGALDSIQKGDIAQDRFIRTRNNLKKIYNDYQRRFEQQVDSMNPNQRKEYLELILVPHMMIIYYLREKAIN